MKTMSARETLQARRLRLSKTTEKIRVTSSTGNPRWVECIVQRVEFGPFGMIASVADVTSYEDRSRALPAATAVRNAGLIDGATGLLNRAALLKELAAEVSRSRRYRNALSVLMIRIVAIEPTATRVAPIDKHRLARTIARMLRERLRWVDVVGTCSKDEFVLVLPETSSESARHLARKIRSYLKGLDQADPVLLRERRILVSLAQWRGDDDAASLLERVSRQLDAASLADATIAIG